VVKDVQGQIAVRVNDADTPPGLDVLKNEIAEQGGFSRACLSDDIDMLAALGDIKTERGLAAPFMPVTHKYVFVSIFHPSRPPLREGHPPRGLHAREMTTNVFCESSR